MHYSIAVHFSTLALLLTTQFTIPISCTLHFVYIQVDATGCSFLLANWFMNRGDWPKMAYFTYKYCLTHCCLFSSVGCEEVFVMCGTELVIFTFEKEMQWKYQEYVLVSHGPRTRDVSSHKLQSLQINAENMNFCPNKRHVNRGVKQKLDRVQ